MRKRRKLDPHMETAIQGLDERKAKLILESASTHGVHTSEMSTLVEHAQRLLDNLGIAYD
ncbi:hypothetical protein AHIS2_p049 [Acaryochloris phage A-HIS2]|nr:hypothetical protein AHIS2_p049 [Acaryochloris phage A-HIS2]